MFHLLVKAMHSQCQEATVRQEIGHKQLEQQRINKGACLIIKKTDPSTMTSAILEFIPRHAHAILSLPSTELTTEKLQQLPRITSSDNETWGVYLHILGPGNQDPVGLYVGSSTAKRYGVWARTKTHEGNILSGSTMPPLPFRRATRGGLVGIFHKLAVFPKDKFPLACVVRLTGLMAM